MAGPSPCRKTSAASICNYPWEGLAEGVSNDWLCRVSQFGAGSSQSARPGRPVQASRLTAVPMAPRKVCKGGLLTAWASRGVGFFVRFFVRSLGPGVEGSEIGKYIIYSSLHLQGFMVHQETEGYVRDLQRPMPALIRDDGLEEKRAVGLTSTRKPEARGQKQWKGR